MVWISLLLHAHGKQVCMKDYQFLLYISYFSGLSRICIRTEWQSSFVLSSRLTPINKHVYTNTESPLWKKLSDTYTAVIIVRLCRNFRQQ